MTIKRVISALLCLLLLMSAVGCSHSAPAETPTQGETQAPTVTQAPTQPATQPPTQPATEAPFCSPLTGLPVSEEVSRQRLISVMINNNKKALPHYGISLADLYIEILAEGEINRIMAVFQDWRTIPKLGSVRSARHYFIDYAQALDSVYLHFGGSDQAFISIKKNGVEDLDGINYQVYDAMYYTDETARKQNGLEHSRFTTGEGIVKGFALKGYRTENEGESYFSFNAQPVAVGSDSAVYVEAPFSGYITPVFEYDSQSKTYLRSEFGEPHIDAGNQVRLSATNLILLYTGHETVDSAGRRKVDTTGSGNGYYISQGTSCPITWSKDSFSEFLEFQKDGKPLSINQGKTWICILPLNKQASTVIR